MFDELEFMFQVILFGIAVYAIVEFMKKCKYKTHYGLIIAFVVAISVTIYIIFYKSSAK